MLIEKGLPYFRRAFLHYREGTVFMQKKIQFSFIKTLDALNAFYQENKEVEWMAFDTEFISERSYIPKLCLVQVATPKGNYILDSILLEHLDGFLELIKNPDIIKITCAGENDYRILFQLYGILPKNVIDLQIAAGFLHYPYPVAFQTLVSKELNIHVNKAMKVSDWSSRPVNESQLAYALKDVLYLNPLWKSLWEKARQLNRIEMIQQECEKLCSKKLYENNHTKEALRYSKFFRLSDEEKIFLLRIYKWRAGEAREKNKPKDKILSDKLVPVVLKNAASGVSALKGDRRMVRYLKKQEYFKIWYDMAVAPVTEEERKWVNSVEKPTRTRPEDEILFDILKVLIKSKSLELGIAPLLLMPAFELKRMKTNRRYFPDVLKQGWRKDLLGETVVNWLNKRGRLSFHLEGLECRIVMESKKGAVKGKG